MSPSYTVTHDSITVILDGQTHTIRRGARNFDAARKAVLDERWGDLPNLMTPGHAIEQWLGGNWSFKDNLIRLGDETVDPQLNDRMIRMAEEGASPTSWMRFWERLQANPSWRSVSQLYAFLAHEGIPIDEEGYILAYKSVTRDYKDHRTKSFDNSPGVTNEMPRNKISDDPRVPCHAGFHVGALKYAISFGDEGKRIVICKVDPANVVCVPYDSSAMKVRVCRYEVLGNYSGTPLPDTTFHEDKYEKDYSDCDLDEDDSDFDTDDAEWRDPNVESDTGGGEPGDVEAEETWLKFDAMDATELSKQLTPDLRAYASHWLKIVGASKIAGGKPALVQRILEVRRK